MVNNVSSFIRAGNLEQVGVQAVIVGLSQYLRGATEVNAANASMARSAQGAATGTVASGTKMSAAFATIGVGAAAAGAIVVASSLKAAIGFETAFAGVRKTVDATDAEFAVLERGIRDMALRLPQTTTEISAVAEAAGQLGVATPNILAFTETMIGLGVATNLSSEEAANALARLANITKLPQDQFDRLGSAVVDLGNKSAATESEILDFGLRIAGAGEIAGLTEADILSIGTAMASVGVEAEAGGTAVQKVLIAITQAVATGSEELKIFAAVAGTTVEEFSTLFKTNPVEAFTRFVEGLGRAGDDAFVILENLGLQDQRLLRSFLSLANAGDLLRKTVVTGNTAFKENTALATEVARRNATTAAQMAILRNNVNELAITFGKILLPALNAIIPPLIAIAQLATAAIGALAGLGDIKIGGVNLGGIGDIAKTALSAGSPLSPATIATLVGKLGIGGSSKEVEKFGSAVEGVGVAAEEAAATTDDAAEQQRLLDELIASFGDETETAAAKVKILEDGIISMAEAAAEGFNAYQAGAIEAVDFIVRKQEEANEASFNFWKTLSKVAYAFKTSTKAAEELVLELGKQALAASQAAAGALFARPTQEQARAQLKVDQLSKQAIQNPDNPIIEANLKAAQKQLELLQADSKIRQDQLTLADRTLLTTQEQATKTQELIRLTGEESTAVRDLTVTLGKDLIPEMDAARESAKLFNGAMSVITLQGIPELLINTRNLGLGFDAAAERTRLLADEEEKSAKRISTAVDVASNNIVTASEVVLNAAIAAANAFAASSITTTQALAQAANALGSAVASASASGSSGYAVGGIVSGPRTIQVGEGFHSEAILPLSRPARAKEILASLPAGLLSQIIPGGKNGPAGGLTLQITGPVTILDPKVSTGSIGDMAFSLQRAMAQRGLLR